MTPRTSGSADWEAIRKQGGPNNRNHDLVAQDEDGELALLERDPDKPCKGHGRTGLAFFYKAVKQCTSDSLRRRLEARLAPGNKLDPCIHLCVSADCKCNPTVDGAKVEPVDHFYASAVVESVEVKGDGSTEGFQLEDHVMEGRVCVFMRV